MHRERGRESERERDTCYTTQHLYCWTFNEAPVVMTLKQGTLQWDNYLAPSQLSFTDALLTAHSMP